MNLQPSFRATLTAIALASLSACATYDDSAMHPACQESPHLKDLPRGSLPARAVATRVWKCGRASAAAVTSRWT